MENSPAHVEVRVSANSELTHVHTHVLSLLYLPIIGKEAFSLFLYLHSLLDRSHLKSPTYPLTFLYDGVGLSPQQFLNARKALEAAGLMETFKGKTNFHFTLYQPLSAAAFIKDSPYSGYLKSKISEERFNDLISHFKIKKTKKTNFKNITVHFDEYFSPLRESHSDKAHYQSGTTKKATFTKPIDMDMILDEIPQSLQSPKLKTKRVKEKLVEIAYLYSLRENDLIKLLKGTLSEGDIDFESFNRIAAEYYHNEPRDIHKKNDPYSEEYFKSVHPRELLEQTTGTRAANVELRTLERLIDDSGLPYEVLNVLLAYVLKELSGDFPSYNYFDKVAAEWKRNNVSTAGEAIEHIKQKKQRQKTKQQTPTQRSFYKKSEEKPEDTNVDWFEDYLKNQEE